MSRVARVLTSVIVAGGLFLAPAWGGTSDDRPVRTKRGVNEVSGTEGPRHIAWTQNSRDRRRFYRVFAKRKVSGGVFRVSRRGPEAADPQLSGVRIVYQEYSGTSSRIAFENLRTRRNVELPSAAQGRQWEYTPSLSGRWLAFARLDTRSDERKLMLVNLTNGNRRMIRTMPARKLLLVGQLNGDFLVWSEGRGANPPKIFRYQISTRETVNVPEGPRVAYGPSVDDEGWVYMVRSGNDCGARVQIVKWRDGTSERVAQFPRGTDMDGTFIYSPTENRTHIVHERMRCSRPETSWNLYRYIED